MKPSLTLALLAASLLTVSSIAPHTARAQGPQHKVSEEAARGFGLLQSGDVRGAHDALRSHVKARPDDADAWHYLGLTLMKGGDAKSAAASFQSAVKLRPDFVAARTGLAYALLVGNRYDDAKREAERVLELNRRSDEAHYIAAAAALKQGDYSKALKEADAALEIQPRFKAAADVKREALFVVFVKATFPERVNAQASSKASVMNLQNMTGYCCIDVNAPNIQAGNMEQSRRFDEAADLFRKSLGRTPDLAGAGEWQADLEALIFWRDYFDPYKGTARARVLSAKAVTTPAQIQSRPAPAFDPEEVKRLGQAVVVLNAVLSETGEVKHVIVSRSLGYGLTKSAMDAARRLQFVPAQKDGRPVSVLAVLEYDYKALAAGTK